ncbi:hypothetical protein IY145_18945 [Methylosinus sp. H3A]|uniref:hypothetical protein n=1 Tax=Methylosinus sp. H3A TaxID=2785786 RepID=UPI0018C26CA2|nr:hypothetical protein [Methylosinus sp. H3A]MBG0811432.1 hypothetical protein [Methylosinus sp. H3A]
MNKIIRENFPAEKLPPELREGLDPKASVTVTIETETTPFERPIDSPIDRMSLAELFSLRRDVFSSAEEAARHIRSLRDEWDD